MSLFDINFNNKAIEWLPVNKRLPKYIAFVQSLLKPAQWARDKFLGDYRAGRLDNYPPWISGATYSTSDLVMLKQVVYRSLTDSNTQQPPGTNWEVYLPSFIGVDERVRFNGIKLVLEYALNRYFQTNFRQPGLLGYYYPSTTPGTPTTPDANHTQHSDIFTLNNDYTIVGFVVGQTEPFCSNVAQHDTGDGGYTDWTASAYTVGDLVRHNGFLFLCIQNTTGSEAPGNEDYWLQVDCVGYSLPFLTGDNFTIYMPSATYALTNDSDIRNFVNKIIPAGIIYNIKTY